MHGFPVQGTAAEVLLRRIETMRQRDVDWRAGRSFSLVYNAGDDVNELLEQVYARYAQSNALSVQAFPSLRDMEVEVVAAVLDLLHAGADAAGSLTSGGTESILMAVKAARDWARRHRPEIDAPEMVLPASAHPAFHKAAHYLGVRPVVVPVGADLRVDLDAVADALGPRTILLVGSAPGFPHGVVDPITELAAMAADRGIWMHVDACLGGFMLPWLERLGHPVPPFDFRVEGVWSMSADIHKYGYAAKGASCVLYRQRALRRHQFFAYGSWPGGVYASPTMSGARGGAPIAAAWAVLHYLGVDGYVERARRALEATCRVIEAIERIDGLQVLGRPDMTVLAFEAPGANVYALGDALEQRGWLLDRLQKPPALHMMLSPVHLDVVDDFVADLAEATEAVRDAPPPRSGMAALYGALAALPDGGLAERLALDFLDGIDRTEAR